MVSDVEMRRRGERKGLDTLVVHAVNDEWRSFLLFNRKGENRTRPFRLGSTIARLELKGIDGGSYKRWSMWFKSIQRAEPYQSLYISFPLGHSKGEQRYTGAAWLSSARVVRCLVKSCNERNPWLENEYLSPQATACNIQEEGGDDVKSSWPLKAGLHMCYSGRCTMRQVRKDKQITKLFLVRIDICNSIS